MRISDLGELALTEKIRTYFSIEDSHIIVPLGDDAAVFRSEKEDSVVTTDLMAEGVHFDYVYTTFYQVGFKLITSNVSDIYAMGGVPSYAFLNIAMNNGRSEGDFDDFLDGVKEACGIYNVNVLGGDISSSPTSDFYSATLIGYAKRPVLRSGARTGDKVLVTGSLGDAAAGLAYMKSLNRSIAFERGEGLPAEDVSEGVVSSVRRHLLPVAGSPVKFVDTVSSMIDVSDGLLIDLFRLCSESGKGVLLYKDRIPVSEGVKKIASMLKLDHMDLALSGGEDYVLLVTSEDERIDDCFFIGEITDEGFYMIDSLGNKEEPEPKGYTHFKG